MRPNTFLVSAMQRARGFTLIETLVAIAILGILAAIGAPGLRALVDSFRVNSARDILLDSVQLARAEAIRTGQPVRIQRQTGCTPDNWACGWTIFLDGDDNGVQGDLDVEPTIRIVEALPSTSISTTGTAATNGFTINNFGQFRMVGFSYNIGPVGESSSLSCTRISYNFGMRANVQKSSSTISYCP